ncbi:hypothetical protein [Granulosicoccus antarcticus]|uniref:Uncharacterized protein n=1 Tax=Granulosicoccus antarcticus IMCC3135 TaxID=1192854 RepID=A0A2Z2P0H6_9GAMM|nr:hypothetical protein [Granulosicoccus antarcticus]ASJ74650.1 hypothetical protein IMCC3135_22900 [Granulosicoccus antarcticus IMCC3135]
MQTEPREKSENTASKRGWRASGFRGLSTTLLLSGTLLLSSCSNDTVPVDANLTLTPETHSTQITERRNAEGQCLFDSEYHLDIPILLQLSTSNGSPIGDAELSIYVDFAENTYTGLSTLELYDDLNSNGVVDEESEYISGFDADIARVKTDQWTGSRMLLMRVNLSCSFQGEVFAFTGGVSARSSIEVVADDIIQPEVTIDEPTDEKT